MIGGVGAWLGGLDFLWFWAFQKNALFFPAHIGIYSPLYIGTEIRPQSVASFYFLSGLLFSCVYCSGHRVLETLPIGCAGRIHTIPFSLCNIILQTIADYT